jgi:hypothetical protein
MKIKKKRKKKKKYYSDDEFFNEKWDFNMWFTCMLINKMCIFIFGVSVSLEFAVLNFKAGLFVLLSDVIRQLKVHQASTSYSSIMPLASTSYSSIMPIIVKNTKLFALSNNYYNSFSEYFFKNQNHENLKYCIWSINISILYISINILVKYEPHASHCNWNIICNHDFMSAC